MTVEHAVTVTMQIADAYVTRCWRPAVAHCRDNVVLCRSYNSKLERRDEVDLLWDVQPVELTKKSILLLACSGPLFTSLILLIDFVNAFITCLLAK